MKIEIFHFSKNRSKNDAPGLPGVWSCLCCVLGLVLFAVIAATVIAGIIVFVDAVVF